MRIWCRCIIQSSVGVRIHIHTCMLHACSRYRSDVVSRVGCVYALKIALSLAHSLVDISSSQPIIYMYSKHKCKGVNCMVAAMM